MEHEAEGSSSKVVPSPALFLHLTMSVAHAFATERLVTLKYEVLSTELSPNRAITFLNLNSKISLKSFKKAFYLREPGLPDRSW